MKGRKCSVSNDQGIAMVAAMLILIIMTVIGISSTKTAIYDTITAHADRKKRTAFYTAEAGLEHAKAQLREPFAICDSITGDINEMAKCVRGVINSKILKHQATDEQPEVVYLKDIGIGAYKYNVFVRNNSDGGGKAIDTDGEFIVRSESASTIGGGERAVVEAVLGYEPPSERGTIQDKTGQFGHGTGKTNTGEDATAITDFTEQTINDTIGQ